jgi:hypothetical protein
LQKQNRLTGTKSPIVLGGPMFVPSGMTFMPTRDYTYCRICGVVYQPELNRVPEEEYTVEVILAANLLRREWSQYHARSHSSTEHRQLKDSGRHCTPEALQKLVPFGIIPVSDIVFDNESEHAGLEAPRAPVNDVEGA